MEGFSRQSRSSNHILISVLVVLSVVNLRGSQRRLNRLVHKYEFGAVLDCPSPT